MPASLFQRVATCLASAAASLALGAAAHATGTLPDRTWSPAELGRFTVQAMRSGDPLNQPLVIDGYLLLAGNASHSIWDIADPYAPRQLSHFVSDHADGEAESHQVAVARSADGRTRLVTISGRGVDLWDVTDVASPTYLAAVELDGIDYGDNTNAVWGVAWVGNHVYVGGTNTGLHIVDVSDPAAPRVVGRVSTSDLGGVSAGPLWVIGNLLVVTTPKEFQGIATLDITNPGAPTVLDFEVPAQKSYIGGFYGAHAYLISPIRVYDVTTDPRNITLVSETATPNTEYLTFADDIMFLGGMRPDPGAFLVDVADPAAPAIVGRVDGRRNDIFGGVLTDDQFVFPIGNLLVLADDERRIGATMSPWRTARETTPPRVLYANPPDGATRQGVTSRVGVSFSDQIDLRSVDTSSFVVRPLGVAPLEGSWAHNQTVLNFVPSTTLLTNTTYEIVLPAGGVKDLVGNAIATEFRSTFSTGDNVAALPCRILRPEPAVVGTDVVFAAEDAGDGATYTWRFGEATAEGASVTRRFDAAGRYPIALTVERDGLTSGCTAVYVAHWPLKGAPRRSGTIAVDSDRERVWVATPDARAVVVLSASGERLATLPTAGAVANLAIAPAAHVVWATSPDADAIDIFDADTLEPVDRVNTRWGATPYGVAFAPDSSVVWVTLSAIGAVAGFDPVVPQAPPVVVELAPGQTPPHVRGVAVDHDGTAWITRFVSDADGGELYVVSPDGDVETIPLAIDDEPDTTQSGRGLPNYLGPVALSPDGRSAWVAGKKDNIERGLARDGQALSTTNTVRTAVFPIDLATGQERFDDRVDLDDHNMGQVIEVSPRGDLLFVLSLGTDRVDILDAYTMRRVGAASTGFAPDGLALLGDRLVVHDSLARTVTVFDASGVLGATDGALRRVGAFATVGEEPLDPQLLLGKQLFVNANSRLMSQDGYTSCATCHLDGDSDGQVWDFTDRGEGLRNTTDLRGRAGTAHGPVHWTGNFDEIQDFEHDIRAHFGGAGLMEDTDFAADGHDHPLGTPKAGVSMALDALAAYVSSFDTYPRSPYRQPDGATTDAYDRGLALFASLDCATCHTGPHLTDSALDLRHDVGTLRETSGQRLGAPLDGIDTPTLHGVWASPPYFHDGSATTLRDTLLRAGHGNAQSLSPAELDDLVAFMLQLEGEALVFPDPPDGDVGTDGSDAGIDGSGDGEVDAADAGGDAGGGSGRKSGCAAAPNTTPPATWLAAVLGAALVGTLRRRKVPTNGASAEPERRD